MRVWRSGTAVPAAPHQVYSPVLDSTKLQHLRQAVDADDWILAADVCLEIALEADTPLDRALAEEFANAVRLRRAEHILDMLDGLEPPDAVTAVGPS